MKTKNSDNGTGGIVLDRLVRPLPSDIENGWNKTQLTKEQAVALSNSGEWKKWTLEEVFAFQMFQQRLAADFSRFHEAVEKVLGRPVWTHEFADHERLVSEYEGKRPKANMADILGMLPAGKTIVLLP